MESHDFLYEPDELNNEQDDYEMLYDHENDPMNPESIYYSERAENNYTNNTYSSSSNGFSTNDSDLPYNANVNRKDTDTQQIMHEVDRSMIGESEMYDGGRKSYYAMEATIGILSSIGTTSYENYSYDNLKMEDWSSVTTTIREVTGKEIYDIQFFDNIDYKTFEENFQTSSFAHIAYDFNKNGEIDKNEIDNITIDTQATLKNYSVSEKNNKVTIIKDGKPIEVDSKDLILTLSSGQQKTAEDVLKGLINKRDNAENVRRNISNISKALESCGIHGASTMSHTQIRKALKKMEFRGVKLDANSERLLKALDKFKEVDKVIKNSKKSTQKTLKGIGTYLRTAIRDSELYQSINKVTRYSKLALKITKGSVVMLYKAGLKTARGLTKATNRVMYGVAYATKLNYMPGYQAFYNKTKSIEEAVVKKTEYMDPKQIAKRKKERKETRKENFELQKNNFKNDVKDKIKNSDFNKRRKDKKERRSNKRKDRREKFLNSRFAKSRIGRASIKSASTVKKTAKGVGKLVGGAKTGILKFTSALSKGFGFVSYIKRKVLLVVSAAALIIILVILAAASAANSVVSAISAVSIAADSLEEEQGKTTLEVAMANMRKQTNDLYEEAKEKASKDFGGCLSERHDTNGSYYTVSNITDTVFNMVDENGNPVNQAEFTNVKEIMSIADVHFNGNYDSLTFKEYCKELWEASHSYSISYSDVTYCNNSNCSSKGTYYHTSAEVEEGECTNKSESVFEHTNLRYIRMDDTVKFPYEYTTENGMKITFTALSPSVLINAKDNTIVHCSDFTTGNIMTRCYDQKGKPVGNYWEATCNETNLASAACLGHEGCMGHVNAVVTGKVITGEKLYEIAAGMKNKMKYVTQRGWLETNDGEKDEWDYKSDDFKEYVQVKIDIDWKEMYGVTIGSSTVAAYDVDEDIESYIWKACIDHGYTPQGAAGLIGNLEAESGLNVDAFSKDGNESIGFVQWTNGRKTNLLNFADQFYNGDWQSVTCQVDFMLNSEMMGGYSGVDEYLRTTDDVELAAGCVVAKYESPSNYKSLTGAHEYTTPKGLTFSADRFGVVKYVDAFTYYLDFPKRLANAQAVYDKYANSESADAEN